MSHIILIYTSWHGTDNTLTRLNSVYQQAEPEVYEHEFWQTPDILSGASRHIHDDYETTLIIDIISEEVIKPPKLKASTLSATA